MAEILFSFDVCLCVCVCVRARSGPDRSMLMTPKTVKATDLRFDTHVSKDSLDMTAKDFSKGAICTLTSAF